MPNPPSGTVTFLFTDVEAGSSPCEQDPARMRTALHRHGEILREAIESNGGYLYKTVGRTSQAAFPTAAQAAEAALDCQQALLSQQWDEECDLRVKMALHTGVTEEHGDDYRGPLLNRVARLLAAGHGGQVLLTQATAMLLRDDLPARATLEDLGEHRLKDLSRAERVYQLAAPEFGLASRFPPLKSFQSHLTNLPLQATSFLGRTKEVAQVRDMVRRDDVVLLTLTGPGGIGKTRLALQVAAEILYDFQDGAFFVPLASINDPSFLASSIANAVGVREVSGQPLLQTLAGFFRHKQLLLVLDNFEHIMDANVQVADLLGAAPKLKALITSRASLHLSIQHEYPVPPMQVPSAGYRVEGSSSAFAEYESVELFVQRAKSVKPGFEMDDQNTPIVAEICYRLEGIPLAIELAAARIKALSPQALLSRLDSRLALLTGGAVDLHSRQQTLRNTIEWSYDLLTSGEKQLFRRMAVFRGGETLDAVEDVCTLTTDDALPATGNPSEAAGELDLLDGISSLVDKSLLKTVEGPGDEPRYMMLETINEYAWEKLREAGEASSLQRRHALHFMRLAEEAEPELKGNDQARWLATLAAEHDNLRAALSWARKAQHDSVAAESPESPVEIGMRIAGAMWRFWYVRGYFSEGRAELSQAFALSQAQAQPSLSAARVKLLNGAAVLASLQGDRASARALGEEGLALARELGDQRAIHPFLDNLGIMYRQESDYTTARSLYDESLALRRELGDKHGIAFALGHLANLLQDQGDYPLARSLQEETLALRRELEDKRGIAISLDNLGTVAQLQGDYRTAHLALEEGLALVRELGDKQGITHLLHNLASTYRQEGNYATALSLYGESLQLRKELKDRRGIASTLLGLGGLAVTHALANKGAGDRSQVELVRGVRLFGAAATLLEELGTVPDIADRVPYEHDLHAARTELGEVLFDKALKEGRAMSMQRAIEYALEESRSNFPL